MALESDESGCGAGDQADLALILEVECEWRDETDLTKQQVISNSH